MFLRQIMYRSKSILARNLSDQSQLWPKEKKYARRPYHQDEANRRWENNRIRRNGRQEGQGRRGWKIGGRKRALIVRIESNGIDRAERGRAYLPLYFRR